VRVEEMPDSILDGTVEGVDEPEAKTSAWKVFVAVALILILIAGIASWSAYRRDTQRDENQYHGFDFVEAAGGLWVTQIQVGDQPYNIPFYHHPRELEDILIDSTATDPLLRGAPREVYISVDPDAGSKVVIAGVEIARITGSRYNLLNLNTKSALSRPADGGVDVPIVTCADASADRVVLLFQQGPENMISREGSGCVVLSYTDVDESVRVADLYAYMLLRIM
jgi:hypothetical protein